MLVFYLLNVAYVIKHCLWFVIGFCSRFRFALTFYEHVG